MQKVLGEHYFIDLDKIEEYLDMSDISNDETSSGTTEMRINVIKLELVKMLLETVLSETEFEDDKLGLKTSNQVSIPFKIAFNSLLNKNLINHY